MTQIASLKTLMGFGSGVSTVNTLPLLSSTSTLVDAVIPAVGSTDMRSYFVASTLNDTNISNALFFRKFYNGSNLGTQFSVDFEAELGYVNSGSFIVNGHFRAYMFGSSQSTIEIYLDNTPILDAFGTVIDNSPTLVVVHPGGIENIYLSNMTYAQMVSGTKLAFKASVKAIGDGYEVWIAFQNPDGTYPPLSIVFADTNLNIDKTIQSVSLAMNGWPRFSGNTPNYAPDRILDVTINTAGDVVYVPGTNMTKLVRANTTVMVSPPTIGTPGTPSSLGYYTTVTNAVWIPPVPLSTLAALTPTNGSYKVSNNQLYGYWSTVTSQVYVPPVVGTPAIPAKSAVYNLGDGWTSAARSIETITGNGAYVFKVPNNVVGVVTGLNDVNTGSSYQEINYAFYMSNGMYCIMLNGVRSSAWLPYTSNDSFMILRVGSEIKFQVNWVTKLTVPAINVPLFADASMYAFGDVINNAQFLDAMNLANVIGPIPMNSNAALKSMVSTSGDYAYSYVASPMAAMTSSAIGENTGSVLANLNAMQSTSSDYAYSYSNASLTPMVSNSASGFEAPSISYADATLQPSQSSSLMVETVYGNSSTSMPAMRSVSSDYAYNYSSVSLAPAVSSDVFFVKSLGFATFNRPSIKALGTTGVSTYAPISIQRPSVKASGAGQARFAIALPKVASSGQSGSIGQARIRVRATVKAYGTTEAIGGARIRVGVNLKAKAYGAGLSKVSISKPSVSSIGITGSIGSARISISSPVVNANGTSIKGGVARISVSVPYIVPAMKARVLINRPSLVAHGTTLLDWNIVNGAPVKATRYAAYAINLRHRSGGDTEQGYLGEVSTYDNYRYNSIVRLGNKYYGSSEDGLFLLEGENDDGVPIKCSMKTATTDLGAIQFKTPKNMYIAGRINGGFDYQVIVGEDDPITHSMPTTVTNKPWSSRVPFASGLRSRYYGFGVSTSESKAEIESLNLEVFIHERA